MVTRRRELPGKLTKKTKRLAGRKTEARTPLNIRVSGAAVDDALREHVRDLAARKLGKFVSQIERMTVHFQDVKGPRRGRDSECNARVVLSSAAIVEVKDQDETPRKVFDAVIDQVARTVKRQIERWGSTGGENPGPRRGTRRATKNGRTARLGPAETEAVTPSRRRRPRRPEIGDSAATPPRSRRSTGGRTTKRAARTGRATAARHAVRRLVRGRTARTPRRRATSSAGRS